MTDASKPEELVRPVLTPPGGEKKVLLHSCCAPCSGEVMEAMLASGVDYTIFFYNPNIHPEKEYLLRKDENVRFAEKHGVPFVDADYDTDNWFARAKGMEWEPERGVRCTMCFDMRFGRTALYAHEHGFPVITSSLGISRWKNMQQITDCGVRRPGLLGLQPAQGRRRLADDRDQQARTCLPAGVLRLRPFAARQQPPPGRARARQDQVRPAVLR